MAKKDKGKITAKKSRKKSNSNVKRLKSTLIEDKMENYSKMVEEKKQEQKVIDPGFNEILGYMPLRQDFDVEYDNEAELFLAEMEFNGNELRLKFKIVIPKRKWS